ncbi:MAG TPA: ABC transporter permease, partial [Candidatus Polarisedimenticolia bacterium]|nr:ABC transporter permease [Candidatus Polarisedimenticolia bacterium]
MGSLVRDLRQRARALARSPGYTVAAVVTLALGIGANSAIFSVLNAVLLRPLPCAEPERVVGFTANLSLPDMKDIVEQGTSFHAVGGYNTQPLDLTGGLEARRIDGAIVTGDLFPMLGVAPALGRTLVPDDDRAGAEPVVLLSHGFWLREFGARPDVVGDSITFGSKRYGIVGVMPEELRIPGLDAEAWVPVHTIMPEVDQYRSAHVVRAIGRLRPGVSHDQARADMEALALRLETQYPRDNTGVRFLFLPLLERFVGDVRPAILMLAAAVGMVLLIACANVANLALSRSSGRLKEVAIRAAMGASRTRLVLHLLSESLLVSLMGGAAGLVLAVWLTDLLIQLGPRQIPRLTEATIDPTVLTVTFALSIAAGLIFGLLPARSILREDLREVLHGTGRTSRAAAPQRLRSGLVITQVA